MGELCMPAKITWTEAEERRLAAAWNHGATERDLAGRFGTSRGPISSKLNELRGRGVVLRSDPRVVRHKEARG